MKKFLFFEFLICFVVLIIIYRLEYWPVIAKSDFAIRAIIVIHMSFFVFGIAVVGFLPTYMIKKLCDILISKLVPKKWFLYHEKSKKQLSGIYLEIYRKIKIISDIIVMQFWFLFLPFIVGGIITITIPWKLGINMPFEYIFYIAPVGGAFYFPFFYELCIRKLRNKSKGNSDKLLNSHS
jgi:hypothetical protein